MRAARILVWWCAAGCGIEDLDGDGVLAGIDCNDRDPMQGREEWLYVDGDLDGFGGTEQELGCPGNSWLARESTDCDDLDALVFPGSVEEGCDGRDNDCDPTTADGPAITVGSTWHTVQAAIDAAGYNEVVQLCASTIHEAIVVRGRPILLQPRDGDALVVIDGTGSGGATIRAENDLVLERVVVRGGAQGGIVVTGCPDVHLAGVVIEANDGLDGAGVSITDCGTLTLEDSIVRDNRATGDGGGLYATGEATVVLDATEVSGNVAGRGGGLWIGAGATLAFAPQVTISGNVADQGGGLWIDGVTLDAAGARIEGNQAREGGGVWGDGDLDSASVVSNTASRGGGLFVDGALSLSDGALDDNAAIVDDGGGAWVPDGSTLELDDVTVARSVAVGRGGGVCAEGVVELDEVRFERNSAEVGGAIACDSCRLTGDEVEIEDATAGSGGAMSVTCGGHATIGGTIADGTAADGAIARVEGGTLVLDHAAVLAGHPEPGGAWLSLASGCASNGVLAAQDASIPDVPDAIGLDGVLRPPPAAWFVCTTPPSGSSGCIPE